MSILRPQKNRPIARNTHVVQTARKTLTAVSAIVQQQNANSIEVSGFPIVIYQRMTGGLPCSCSDSVSPRLPAMYDEQGHAAPSLMNTLKYQAGFSIEDYNPVTPSQVPNEMTVVPSSELDVSNVIEADPDFFDNDTETPLSAYNSSACNICHGTGYKGGYSFLQGARTILDHSDLIEATGIEVDRQTAPYTIRCLSSTSKVSFNFTNHQANVPTVIFVWNNFERVFPVQGSDAVKMVQPDSSLYSGNGPLSQAGTYTLDLSDVPQDFEFTHVEILQLYIQRPVFADFPALVAGFDPSRISQYQDTTVVLPPSLPVLKPRDVIADLTHGLRWIVTSVNSLTVPTTGNQQWSQSVDCRPLEPYEPASKLLLPYGVATRYRVAGISHSNFSRINHGGF